MSAELLFAVGEVDRAVAVHVASDDRVREAAHLVGHRGPEGAAAGAEEDRHAAAAAGRSRGRRRQVESPVAVQIRRCHGPAEVRHRIFDSGTERPVAGVAEHDHGRVRRDRQIGAPVAVEVGRDHVVEVARADREVDGLGERPRAEPAQHRHDRRPGSAG